MKTITRVLMLAVFAAGTAAAQRQADPMQVSAPPQPPSYSDRYCAGFITPESISTSNYVAEGIETPHATRYGTGDIVFLHGGSVMQPGAQFAVVRHSRDPNPKEVFPGQRSLLRGMGRAYADMGRVRVLQVQSDTAIAQVEFSCDAIVPGDLLVPFVEKPEVPRRAETSFNRFALPPSRVNARIAMSRDFGMLASTGNIVYLSAGSSQGVRPGDVFRAVRGYPRGREEEVDALTYKSPAGEPTQVRVPRTIQYERLPRRILGEMVVLSVSSTSSTAMVTLALEEMQMGDAVELHQSRE
jgi:hypothetical protein